MPVYVVSTKSQTLLEAHERSPRVVLATDASDASQLAPQFREVADQVLAGNLKPLRKGQVPKEADAVLIALKGERLLQGTAAAIRNDLRQPEQRVFVPVHYPCLPELDLIALEPRWFTKKPKHECGNLKVRIAAPAQPSVELQAVLKHCPGPWAQLSRALLKNQGKLGSGIEALNQLWNPDKLPPVYASLILRNLIVLLIRENNFQKAEEFLKLGMSIYPEYAELLYLGAVLQFRSGTPSKAVKYFEKISACKNQNFVGSGGENSYRAQWLLGTLASHAGDQKMAYQYFLPGLLAEPPFKPAVESLLNERLSRETAESLQWRLCSVARRQPQFLDAIFNYLLLHRCFDHARRLIETVQAPETSQEELQQRLESARAPFRAASRTDATAPGVMLIGPFLSHSSLGRINRAIAAALLQAPDLDAALEPHYFGSVAPQEFPEDTLLLPGLLKHPQRLDLTIRHQWPVDFRKPSTGKLVHILPWEYSSVPRPWVRKIQESVDELWVPSNFVREAFIGGGVAPDRVRVIPNGVDTSVFAPEGKSWRPESTRGFMFLFAGGAIRRKGVDLLLEAYQEAFHPGDDVTLVFLDLSSHGFYAHNSLVENVWKFARNPKRPHVLLLTKQLTDTNLASLYRGCDVFVLPYRAEGFGMPLAEAMACGKPVITTGLGPAPEFCDEQTSYLIPAKITLSPDNPPNLGELTGPFTWFEPDPKALVATLRQVYENRQEAARKGQMAAQKIAASHNWARITSMYLDGVRALVNGTSAAPALAGREQERINI